MESLHFAQIQRVNVHFNHSLFMVHTIMFSVFFVRLLVNTVIMASSKYAILSFQTFNTVAREVEYSHHIT